MKTILTVAFMGVAVAIAMGVIGVQAISDSNSEIPTLSSSGLNILGHATFTVTDSEGNIKAYRQTDNAIITTGKDCVARFLFDNATAEPSNNNCKDSQLSSGFTGFRFIALDNTTNVNGLLDSSATLAGQFTNEVTGWSRVGATPSYTAATGTTGTIVDIESGSVGIDDAIGSTNVTRSALMDASSGSVAAAIINIPNGVSVATGDSLAVNWQVTVG
jgi:hypothetical protein